MSVTSDELVITGIGVASPLGMSCESLWTAMVEGTSGVRRIASFDPAGLPVQIAAEVRDFDPLAHIKPRKSIKVMARDAQIAVSMAGLAHESAKLEGSTIDPERFGVVLGADTINAVAEDTASAYRVCMVDGKLVFGEWGRHGMFQHFPLGMLKLLPNMLASHISIAQDARGPNNTIYNAEVSSLLALGEAAGVITRGHADIMFAGGASSRMQPLDWVHSCLSMELSQRNDAPERASRPFEATRDGQVRGEGGAAIVLERRSHAEARGATITGRLLGWSSGTDASRKGSEHHGAGLRRAINSAMQQAGITPSELSHVNAHGLSTREGDVREARVLAELLPDVPVTAPKGHFGNLSAAGGALETVVSLLALQHGLIPPTLNYDQPDPACKLNIVHGAAQKSTKPYALVINLTQLGQAAAVVVGN